MNPVKKFDEFINENSNKVKLIIQDDDYSIMGIDIENIINHFSKIPTSKLKKQYIDFKSLLKLPPSIGDPLFEPYKQKRLNEGYDKSTVDMDEVIESITKKYNLDDWQIIIEDEINDTNLIAVIPHVGDNGTLIIEDMDSLGYYKNSVGELQKDNIFYSYISFAPKNTKRYYECC